MTRLILSLAVVVGFAFESQACHLFRGRGKCVQASGSNCSQPQAQFQPVRGAANVVRTAVQPNCTGDKCPR